ncbi:MAG: S8 family serine peptidase, partial [Bacteroidales bacterium]|nr:S8 family serine peptidase [Bacteroidales bacterium]
MNIKRLIINLLFCFVIIYLNGQDFYMYVNGHKRTFDVSVTKILVKSEVLDTSAIKNAMQQLVAGNVKSIYDLNNQIFMVFVQNFDKESIMELQQQWNTKENVIYSSPVFIDETGKEIAGFTNQILVRLKNLLEYSLLIKSTATYQIKDIKQCVYDELSYLLTLENGSVKNAIQIANELYETDLFEYAEPNLIHFLELSTNDQYSSQQWALNNTGQIGGIVGIDIKAEQAWSITTGMQNIRIAILDVGVELSHPDLVDNLLLGFDATDNDSDGAPINNLGDSAHGTACAGIAAAHANNTIGIAGVAYNCRILPVRIATSSGGWTTTESQFIVNGINWARQNGADVISMSFSCVETAALNTIITNVVTSGENSKGCVLVASSGNYNASVVDYPACLNNVIAVGAMSQCGQRKSFTSCDGKLWGSNYGVMLDIVAPGVDIYTTGMQTHGSTYNIISNGVNGVYFSNFGGTSAAAPHVAGVAALILSVNPNLTAQQVRDIIESTAQKVRTDLYNYSTTPGRPNGTWHEEMGYGLVNAHAAVSVAASSLLGSSTICGSATYSLSHNVQATSWYVSPTKSFSVTPSSGNSSTVTALVLNGQAGTLTAVVSGMTFTKVIQACQLSITGPDIISSGTCQATYTLANLPANATNPQWSCSQGLV